ncbi:hypothetical protein ACPA54_04330 [Uniformispora flossi]|uniref:hypothetical protein n=1 Tax=Uniformispora flossi TaxID=3390723 RepID=UPI003C3089FD
MSVFRRLLPVVSAVGLTAALCTAVPTPAAAASEAPIVVATGWSAPGEVATATCPTGTGLVGGGYQVNPYANGLGQVVDFIQGNTPSSTTPNSWSVKQLMGQSAAFAMCVEGAPTPTVIHSDWSENGNAVTATCPDGQNMIGGGYASIPVTNGVGQNMDEIQTNTPVVGHSNTWAAGMKYGRAMAFVMCVD